MTGPTKRPITKYECNICQKPYVKQGCLNNHLKNFHQANDSRVDKEFLDSSTYSELDRDETILRTVGQMMTADRFMQDVVGEEDESWDDPTETTQSEIYEDQVVDNLDVEPIRQALGSTPTTVTVALVPPVPLCANAQRYILRRGNTLPASLLASLLPAPDFLEDLDKSLKEHEQSKDVTNILTRFEEDIRCHMCELCGITFTGKINLDKHMSEGAPISSIDLPSLSDMCEVCGITFIGKINFNKHMSQHDQGTPTDMPSLGDYLASMKESMDRQTMIMSTQSATMSEQIKIISRQGVMIEKLLAFQITKESSTPIPNVTVTLDESSLFSKCNKCEFETDDNSKLHSHMNSKHNKGPELIKCPMCNFTNSDSTELIRHVTRRHPEKYECDVCHQQFTCKTELTKHGKAIHEQIPKSPGLGLLIGDSHTKSVSNRILEKACNGKRLRYPARSKPRWHKWLH